MTLPIPGKRGEPQRRLRVLVRTEGPTRVLTVLDTERHRCGALGWVGLGGVISYRKGRTW